VADPQVAAQEGHFAGGDGDADVILWHWQDANAAIFMRMDDTIIALSSAAGSSPRAVIRLSGGDAFAAMAAITETQRPAKFPARVETKLRAPLPAVACEVLAFAGPKSFSGQDIAELHLPGSPALVQMVIDAALAMPNVRMADPGEFSARAFFSGKMDLTEAEGIAAVISAANQRQLRAATSLREGVLHKQLERIAGRTADVLALTEAGIDFSDEEGVQFISPIDLATQLNQVDCGIHDTLAESVRVDRLEAMPVVVFVGRPNVGKSSLINALTGRERSIVSPIAGTTRDMLAVVMQTDRGPIRLVDVPGEEEAADEMREKMMQSRQSALMEADLVLNVLTHPTEVIVGITESADFPARCVQIQNKSDLLPAASGAEWRVVSAKTGRGIDKLRVMIAEMAVQNGGANHMAINQRHRQLLCDARTHLETAMGMAAADIDAEKLKHPELIASELRLALDLLGQITGTISPDEILGRIFSRFCIGK
jgi:tRNA modification GTPase